jgi:peptidyl-prolyl cis-trans isomerase D
MLESLRLGVQSWYFKALLMVLVASFAVFGIGDIFSGGPSLGAIVTVGDTEIGGAELSDAYRRRMNAVSRQLGTTLTTEQARQFGIVDQVVQSLVSAALYDAEADALGVVIGDGAIAARIRMEPSFKGQQGQFDRGIYEQVLAANGMVEQAFIDSMRREISRDQLLGSLAGALPQSTQLADRLYRWRNERRTADYIVLKYDPNSAVATPDDTILRRYHGDNAARFTAPDYRKITYIHLTPDDVMGNITIPENELRDAYDSRLDEFSIAERRTVQQMIFADEVAARKAAGMLAEGRAFVALAKKLANQDPKATNLGDVLRDGLPGTLGENVFKLSTGETSPPLKGPFGWYLMRVIAVKQATIRSLEEVRALIHDELASDRAIEVLFELSNTLQDILGGGATLAAAASQIGAKLIYVAALDRQGRGADGKPIADIPQGLIENAYNTLIDEQSALVDSGDSGYLIVQVESETPSVLREFGSVRNDVIAAWKREYRRDKLENRANEIVERLNKGAGLRHIAAELKLGAVTTSAAFTRAGQDAGANVPRGLAADLFASKIGGGASAETTAGFTVAILKKIRKADPVVDKKTRDALADRLIDDMAGDLIVQYNNALRRRHAVEVNQRALDNLFLQN